MSDSYFDTDDITKEYDGKIVRRILSYLKPYKVLVVFTIAALVLSTLGELYIPVLQQKIIDKALLGKDVPYLVKGCILYLIILVIVFIFTFCQTWTAALMTQRVMKDMRIGLFSKTVSQSTDFLSRHPVGRIVTRLTGDVETMDEFLQL